MYIDEFDIKWNMHIDESDIKWNLYIDESDIEWKMCTCVRACNCWSSLLTFSFHNLFIVCGSDIEIAACMASSWNIPIISPSGSSARVTDKTEFTTLTNMAFTMEKFATFYMNIYNEYQWKDIALIFDDDSSLLDLLARSLHSEFRKSNFTTFLLPFQDKSFRFILREASKYSRGELNN